MVPLDRAMKSFYRLSIVTVYICSGLAAILNVTYLPAAITHVRRIACRILALIVAFGIAVSLSS